MKQLILASLIIITGCGTEEKQNAALEYAQALCKDKGGLKALWVYGNLVKPMCNNGTQESTFQAPRAVLKPK